MVEKLRRGNRVFCCAYCDTKDRRVKPFCHRREWTNGLEDWGPVLRSWDFIGNFSQPLPDSI